MTLFLFASIRIASTEYLEQQTLAVLCKHIILLFIIADGGFMSSAVVTVLLAMNAAGWMDV